MGYRRLDISAIFLWQGALIAVAGSVVGCLLGASMTWGVSHIPIRIRGLLYADHFLVTWEWRHYFWATLLAILAVFIASYVPARQANSRLRTRRRRSSHPATKISRRCRSAGNPSNAKLRFLLSSPGQTSSG